MSTCFETIHTSALNEFESNGSQYVLWEQWKKYVLFLVIPRMEFNQGNQTVVKALLPYKAVQWGDEIIIYGMGAYRTNLYRYLTDQVLQGCIMC